MKIALIVKGGLHPSGREQVIPSLLALAEQLAKHHDVHAIVLGHLAQAQRYAIGGATVHDLGRPVGPWRQWRAVNDVLASYGPFDVVHGVWADPAGLLAALAGQRHHIPSVVTCNTGEFVALPALDYGLQRSALRRARVALACRLATVVHVSSAYMQALARRYGVEPIRIPHGIDLQHFSFPGRRDPGPPWRLLQVASLNAIKDHATLLAAVARLHHSLDIHLDLVGEDTLNGRLRDRVVSSGLADRVTFHGFVPHDRLVDHYHRAHVYVQSSQHEAAGVAVLEAAATGLPIVGTRVGYLSDWDGVAALGVAPGDAAALADAITTVLCDPSRRAALGEAARARVIAECNILDTAARMTGLYERVRDEFAGRRRVKS